MRCLMSCLVRAVLVCLALVGFLCTGAPCPPVFARSVALPAPLQDPELKALERRLQKAVTDRDEQYVLSLVHAKCSVSHGGFRGPDDFREYWFGNASHGIDFFEEMQKALNLGGVVLENGSAFVLPYTATAPSIDEQGVMLGVIAAPAVNVRAWPGLKGRLLGVVGHETVRMCNIEVPIAVDGMDWTCILMPDGQRGYVSDMFLVKPTGIRFLFRRLEGRWMLVSTVAGE